MKPSGAKRASRREIALALTWDGARWPVRTLPAKAQAFLAGRGGISKRPSSRETAALLADDQVKEIRICWVPALKGGDDVLSDPFQTASGKRIPFRASQTVPFGDILGVVYRRR